MKKVYVRLNTVEDAVRFVRTVDRYPFAIDLRWDHYQINAKSLLGVMGLSTGECVDLCIDTMDPGNLLGAISDYIVA